MSAEKNFQQKHCAEDLDGNTILYTTSSFVNVV